jgi:hypothetical protein
MSPSRISGLRCVQFSTDGYDRHRWLGRRHHAGVGNCQEAGVSGWLNAAATCSPRVPIRRRGIGITSSHRPIVESAPHRPAVHVAQFWRSYSPVLRRANRRDRPISALRLLRVRHIVLPVPIKWAGLLALDEKWTCTIGKSAPACRTARAVGGAVGQRGDSTTVTLTAGAGGVLWG